MRVIGKTIQQREARLNVDSLVNIATGLDSNPQSVSVTTGSPGDPNLNVSLADYTVSMVVEAQGAWSVGLGSWQVSEADYQPTHLTHIAFTATEIFVNSERVGTHTKSWDGVGDLVLSATQYIQHLKIANRSWTQEEIRADRWQPGYAPASTHASILAHYVADREGSVMWDCVGQYNYAKATALQAYHATLQNFTPEQVEGGRQSAYRNFYTKQPYLPSSQPFNGVDQYADAGVNPNINNAIEYNVDWSLSAWINVLSAGTHFFLAHGHETTDYRHGIVLDTYLGYIELQIGKFNQVVRLAQYEVGVPLHLSFNRLTDGNYEVFKNGVPVSHSYRVIGQTINSSIYKNAEAIWTLGAKKNNQNPIINYGNVALDQVVVLNTRLTQQQARNLYRSDGYPPNELQAAVVAHYVADSTQAGGVPLVMPDLVADSNASLTAYPAALTGFSQVDDVIEKSSLLPPLRNAVKFVSASSQSGTAGNIGNITGIRFAVQLTVADQPLFTLDNTASTDIAVVAGTLTIGNSITGAQCYVDGNPQTLVDAGAILNDLGLHDVVLLFDSIAATDFRITVGDKHLAALNIVTGTLTRKNAIELSNNTLLANPTARLQDQLGAIWNLNNILDDGAGNYTLTNGAVATAPSTITLNGYTAPNLDPTNPAYSLTPINDLR